jgi:hypothetical protein
MEMINRILEYIFGSKQDKIRKTISKKHTQAIAYQRNGNIKEYSFLMKEIEDLEVQYERLQNS